MDNKILFIFPPNWSAIVPSPHLALPLLSGSCFKIGWDTEIWDISNEFYNNYAIKPQYNTLLNSVLNKDFMLLDNIYFEWENQFISLLGKTREKRFGLL